MAKGPKDVDLNHFDFTGDGRIATRPEILQQIALAAVNVLAEVRLIDTTTIEKDEVDLVVKMINELTVEGSEKDMEEMRIVDRSHHGITSKAMEPWYLVADLKVEEFETIAVNAMVAHHELNANKPIEHTNQERYSSYMDNQPEMKRYILDEVKRDIASHIEDRQKRGEPTRDGYGDQFARFLIHSISSAPSPYANEKSHMEAIHAEMLEEAKAAGEVLKESKVEKQTAEAMTERLITKSHQVIEKYENDLIENGEKPDPSKKTGGGRITFMR